MSIRDSHGLTLSGADATSLEHYGRALHQFQCYIEDPVASVDAALARSPDFVMAHVLKAYLNLLGTEPQAIAVARASLAAAARCDGPAHERGPLEAVGHPVQGPGHPAGRVGAHIAGGHPRATSMGGVRRPSSKTVTGAVRGTMRSPATRAEAMSLIIG